MRFSGNIGIHANGDCSDLTKARGAFDQRSQFGFAFDIEEKDSRFYRCRQLGASLTDTRKDDSLRGFAIWRAMRRS